MTQPIPRRAIQGIQTLHYAEGPYIEVAERLRLLHTLAIPFSVEHTEILSINDRWVYRIFLTVNGEQYIGDAEIHFHAPKETPDGTNPVSCGQTSAIGNALTFAGFADLRFLLERLGQSAEPARQAYPSEPPHDVIEGIRVVWLDETPYVPVAERLYVLHTLGWPFTMERCEILEINHVWIYRAFVTVNRQQYIGDAEIHFDAPEGTPDARFPISCGQTSAMGNALAIAGIGDVRSILERQGKDPGTIQGKPVLASADAVLRAKRQQKTLAQRIQPESHTNGSPPHTATPAKKPAIPLITAQQQATIQALCTQLGEATPEEIDIMPYADAQAYIEVLRIQQEELLQTAEEARSQEKRPDAHAHGDHDQDTAIATHADIGVLKRAWMQAFGVKGEESSIRRRWQQFKEQVCRMPVDDNNMGRQHYAALTQAIEQRHPQARPSTRHAHTTKR